MTKACPWRAEPTCRVRLPVAVAAAAWPPRSCPPPIQTSPFTPLSTAALFEHFGVNSLSAFRQKFWARELRPGGPGSGDGQPIPTTPASCSRWQVQQQGKEMYVGETLNGMRHGGGILLSKVRGRVLLAGEGRGGKQPPSAHAHTACA